MGRLNAADASLPVWPNEVLKLDPATIGLRGSPTQVRKIFAPERPKGQIVEGQGEHKQQAVTTMTEKLVNLNFVLLDKS